MNPQTVKDYTVILVFEDMYTHTSDAVIRHMNESETRGTARGFSLSALARNVSHINVPRLVGYGSNKDKMKENENENSMSESDLRWMKQKRTLTGRVIIDRKSDRICL